MNTVRPQANSLATAGLMGRVRSGGQEKSAGLSTQALCSYNHEACRDAAYAKRVQSAQCKGMKEGTAVRHSQRAYTERAHSVREHIEKGRSAR